MGTEVYEVIKLDESSWRIEEDGVRSFLFVGTDRAVLIDSGFGTGNLKELVGSLTDLPVILVNTHADGDHLGCNNLFDKAYMHPAEFDRYHKSGREQLTAVPLWEGDVIDLGNRRFEVILIPGHTPGSIVLLDEENRFLIGGDSIQAGMIYMFGAGRDISAYILSMEMMSQMKQRFDTDYPSHGPFPVDSDIINALVSGAKQLQDGKITGVEPPRDVPAKLYDIGEVRFLY